MAGPRGPYAAVLCLLALSACSGTPSWAPALPHASPGVRVTSPSFQDGAPIPARFTCDGRRVSPPLSWAGVPHRARALALVVDDPDAPGGRFVHWIVLDIPAGTRSVREGAVPPHSLTARNSAGRPGYTAPCPPRGTHHYRFTVYALSAPTGLPSGAAAYRALRAVADRALAQGRLVGTYRRR